MIIMNNGRPTQDTAQVRRQRLLELTTEIQSLVKVKSNQFRIAVRLNAVKNERLFLDAGFKNIYEYGLQIANLKRMTVNYYCRIANDFLNPETERTIFADERGRDYGYMQMLELLRIDKEEATELIKAGTVTYDTTATEIRAIVGRIKEKKDKDKADAKRAVMEPFEAAHEAFHEGYNNLKAHLLELGDEEGADKLLPVLMDAIVTLYQEGKKGLEKK